MELASRAAAWLRHVERRLLALSALVEGRRSELLGRRRRGAEDSLKRRHVASEKLVSRDRRRARDLLNSCTAIKSAERGRTSRAQVQDWSLRAVVGIHLEVLRLLFSSYAAERLITL